jgi:peptide deformylase
MSILQTKLRIHFYGNPVLRQRSKPVDAVGPLEQAVFVQMEEVMRCAGGVGLAAPQVGLSKQLVIVDVGEGPVALANPKILKKWGSAVVEEGCLSLPGIYVKVRRARKIKVTGLNEKNEKVVIVAADFLARALQHEIDHLRGKLIFDYAGFFVKLRLKARLKEIKTGPQVMVA